MMPQAAVKKLTSLFLICMISAVSAFGLCQETHATEQCWRADASCDAPDAAADDHCPACPDASHSGADHCASSCFCSCHLSMTSTPVHIQHIPVVAEIIAFEAFTVLPEVYIAMFIPPQIHV
jgi:hypothetical protein